MEYAVRLSNPGAFPHDPRRWCPPAWQDLLPKGTLKAVYFGTEFCQDLLPSAVAAEKFCALAQESGLEACLLTPVVRADGLGRILDLVSALADRGWSPTLVFNDLGVLQLLRQKHPALKLQAGRLLNRALRDPRYANDPSPEPLQRGSRGGAIRSLLSRCGVKGLETDADLDGTYLGDGTAPLQRVLHLPYVFAASGRNCLLKAEQQTGEKNFARLLRRPCAAPCRERCNPETRPDLKQPLWRAGNTLFYAAERATVARHLTRADRVVLHERPQP
jgi:hypothetical protein